MNIIEIDKTRAYPPRVTEFTRPFWDALANGKFITTHCGGCGEATFPPKPICPKCAMQDMAWTEVPTGGRLYAYTIVHIAPEIFQKDAPYAVGIIDLYGGLRLAARIYGGQDQYEIGGSGNIVCLKYQDGPLFAFQMS